MQNDQLEHMAKTLNKAGWFIPPYVSLGLLETLALAITKTAGPFAQADLEKFLATIYDPRRLASMVLNRYPQTPVIDLYQETISEAVFAHFAGLRHVAIGGLLPTIEGIATELLKQRGLEPEKYGVKFSFKNLLTDAKEDVMSRKIGAAQEIVNMLDGFLHFIKNYLFERSAKYPLEDNTNRPGILHGTFKDADYGDPIGFYKIISAIDILTLVSALKTKQASGFAPNETPESRALAEKYCQMRGKAS